MASEPDQTRELQLRVIGGDDSDEQEVADLAWGLKEELLRTDVEAVEHKTTEAPAGAKGDFLAWAELVVTLSGNLPALIGVVRSWLGRQDQGRVTIELDGDVLTLDRTSPETQGELINTWLRRHSGDE